MYIARDKNGKMYLHIDKPVKKDEWCCWWTTGSILELSEEDLSQGVNPQWEDEEPIEVELKLKTKIWK